MMRWNGSPAVCASTCANSTPADRSVQPAPTTSDPAATDGWIVASNVIGPQLTPAGTAKTICVSLCAVIVAALEPIVTAVTETSPVPVIVTGAPAATR